MGRPRGVRNQDYDSERAEILRRVGRRLLAEDGGAASFRDLARAADVSAATLRHYFATREELIAAVLGMHHAGGMVHLQEIAAGQLGPVAESLRFILGYALAGLLDHGVADLHVLGLTAGLGDPVIGPAYLDEVLEPTLQALEARLERHIARGELRAGDVRAAALGLLAPLVLAALHQRALGGDRCRPLDLQKFLATHLEAFLRAWVPEQPPPPPPPPPASRGVT